MRLKWGLVAMDSAEEFRQRIDERAHFVLQPNGDAQIGRQAVIANRPRHDATRDQEGLLAASAFFALSSGKRTSRKLATLGTTSKPRPSRAAVILGRQMSLWARAASRWAISCSAANPATWAGTVTLNGIANAVQHVGDLAARRIGPAQPNPCQRISLGERPKHDDIASPRGPVRRSGGIVVADDVFGIGRVDHQQHVVAQPLAQAVELVWSAGNCQWDCWGWRRRRSACAR